MRFHVPNNELEKYLEEKEKAAEESKEPADEEMGENEEQMTAAKLFDDKIHKRANIGEFAGEVIATISELPLIIPRGYYSLEFYNTFCKLHGKTHDYKIMHKDISKVFMLAKPDGVHMVYLIQLDQPLRTGGQLNYFIAMNFELEREVKVKIKMTPQEISAKYGANLRQETEGKLYDVLSQLFNHLVGVKRIIVPGEFQSSRGTKALGCSVKASEGYLFPLKSSLVFINKPVHYIRHSEIRHVEFSRTGQGASRTFDVTISKLKEEPNVTFLGIDREEQRILIDYFKASNVKMKVVDIEGNKQEMSQVEAREAGDADMAGPDYDDEEESEDESFNEEAASGSGPDSESGEFEADSDVVDEEMDKHEVRALQKEVGKVDINKGRPKRTRK